MCHLRSLAPRPMWRSLGTAADCRTRDGLKSVPVRSAGGFTLLEILVVVVIIGIAASFAVLAIGSRALEDRLDTEARRLHELIGLAAEQATLQGVELGFVHTPDGYAFLALKDGAWVPPDEAGPLRARALREPFYLQLRVDGRPVPPFVPEDESEKLAPHVLLLSSGEATAFSLDVRARQYAPYYELRGDALGRLTLERKEPS